MFKKRFGNKGGYEDKVIYTEVLDNKVYKTYQNGVIRYKKSLGFDESELTKRNNLEWLIPKIPFKYYMMTLDFYKEVNKRHGAEACVLFYWNKDEVEIPKELMDEHGSGIIQDGKLIVIAPEQYNHGTLSQFTKTVDGKEVLTDMVAWLEKNTLCIMETHSHNTMGAFWSATDSANENHSKLRLFSVFGNITTTEDVKVRVNLLGDYFDLAPEDVFEFPIVKKQAFVGDVDVSDLIEDFDADEPELFTGPFGYNGTHPDSWFDLFNLLTVSRYKKGKSNQYKNGGNGKNFTSYLDNVDLGRDMLDMEDEKFWGVTLDNQLERLHDGDFVLSKDPERIDEYVQRRLEQRTGNEVEDYDDMDVMEFYYDEELGSILGVEPFEPKYADNKSIYSGMLCVDTHILESIMFFMMDFEEYTRMADYHKSKVPESNALKQFSKTDKETRYNILKDIISHSNVDTGSFEGYLKYFKHHFK